MKQHGNTRRLTVLAALVSLAWVGPAVAVDDPELPPPGLYWRSPRPDALGNMNYALGAMVRLHAAPVELAPVDRVVYFVNGTEVGQVANPPYAFDWTAQGSGAVALRAEARSGATVQGWCERTIQVIAAGLQVAQSTLAVSVATGATTTVSLNLTNLGPGDTQWAVHVKGGSVPGGTAGNVDRAFTNPPYYSPRNGRVVPSTFSGRLAYRDCGTAATDDDEFLVRDGEVSELHSNTQLRRRSVADWSDKGLLTAAVNVQGGCFTAEIGDGLWASHNTLLSATTGNILRQFTPPPVYVSFGGAGQSHNPAGVTYAPVWYTFDYTDQYKVQHAWFVEFREWDGMYLADHGEIPAMTSKGASTPQTQRYWAGGGSCWHDGHVWFVDNSTVPVRTTIDLWRWHPGMADAVLTVSVPPRSYGIAQDKVTVVPAAEPGFLWVATFPSGAFQDPEILHVDTGLRPWLRLAKMEMSGTLANGAGRAVSVTIDATTAPPGTYQAVLTLTQYPNSLIPQIHVPVTLTVTSGGSNQPPTLQSPAWAEPPAVTLPAGTTVHVVASDPDGDPLSYAWTKVSGAGTATFATPAATDSGVTFSAAGTYVLRVAVTDGRGGSVTSEVSVTVNAGGDVDARADCNADGVVNALDLQIVIANFGKVVP